MHRRDRAVTSEFDVLKASRGEYPWTRRFEKRGVGMAYAGELIDELVAEAGRQDAKHGPFQGATRLGLIRLAVACTEDEMREVLEAWADTKGEGDLLRTELLQLSAVALRAVRDIDST